MAIDERSLKNAGDPRAAKATEDIGKAALIARMFDDAEKPLAGRFKLDRRVGEGAMGTVWAADDEDLDRRVAVKLLNPAPDDGREDDARVLAEARVLASVNHPNVVHVYEVGIEDDKLFIAMEFVDGPTLRAWVEDTSPSWDAIVAKYVEAARGLAAAHAVGVVHRDFKPDNALVGSDGRVRVVDFGLAGEGAPLEPTDATSTSTRRRGGTPAYMAPEQIAGAEADARADQFTLCVSLFEALAGRRPYDAGPRDELQLERLPAHVPAWVRAALTRGLSAKPEDRFPTMGELIDALDRDAGRLRRRRWLLGGVAVAVVTAAVIGRSTAAEPDVCPDARERLAGAWDDETRDAVRQSLRAAAPSYADASLERIEPRLDAYTDAWVDAQRDACEATRVRGEQSETLLDARVRCLAQRRRRLKATVQMLVGADARVAEKAVTAVERLPPVAECADLDRVTALYPAPRDPAIAAAVDAELDRLAHAGALLEAGRFQDALEEVEQATQTAEELDFPPLRARADRLMGYVVAQRGGHVEEAADLLAQAYRSARSARQLDVSAQAAANLAYVLARYSTRLGEAKTWAGLATLEGQMIGSVRLQAAGRNAEGIALARDDDYVAAEVAFGDAVELLEALGDSSDLLTFRTNRARNARIAGKLEAAAEAAAKNLAGAESLLGPHHPGLLPHLDLLAEMLATLGNGREAEPLLRRALEIAERANGPDHPTTARFFSTFGRLQASLGDLDGARASLERALQISETSAARGSELMLHGVDALGDVYMQMGETELGLATLRRNIQEQDRVNPRGRDAAVARGRLARALLELGKAEEALPLAETTVAYLEAGMGPTHVDVSEGLWVRARAFRSLGRLDDAAKDLERAIEIVDAGFSPDSPTRAEGRIRLADVRLEQGRRAEAQELAELSLKLAADVWSPERVAAARDLLARAKKR